MLVVRDAGQPTPLALPRYSGAAYIYASLAAAGLWLLTSVPLLAAAGLVVVSESGLLLHAPATAAVYLIKVHS